MEIREEVFGVEEDSRWGVSETGIGCAVGDCVGCGCVEVVLD